MSDILSSVTTPEPGATCDQPEGVTRETITILVQRGNARIIRHEDGSLAPQRAKENMWLYQYYQDGWPVIVPPTDAGRAECEAWTGLSLKREGEPR